MATYQNPQLQELLQLAQLSEMLGKGDAEQQQVDQSGDAARMTAAIHLIGLQQSQQNDAAQRSHEAASLEEQKNYHSGELAHLQATAQQAGAALEEQRNYHQGELSHLHDALEQSKVDRSATTDANVIDRIISDQSLPWSAKEPYIATRPSFAPIVKAAHDKAVADAVPKITSMVQTIYGTPSIANDPAKRDAALQGARAINPDAYDTINHEKLKAHLPSIVSSNTAVQLGHSARILGTLTNPATTGALWAQGAKKVYEKTNKTAVGDFLNALMGNK